MAPANNLKRVVRLTVLVMLTWVESAAWASTADAFESFYDDNCISCHDSEPAARTCAGCHAHGVHPNSVKDTLNVTAVPDRRSYSPGDFINIEVGGGYLYGWVRTQVWDLDCDTPGTCSQGNVRVSEKGTSANSPGPVTLTATVPTAPGNYTWYAGRHVNDYDEAGAAFGEFPGSVSGSNLWIPDAENWGHGNEVVAFSFTVVEPNPEICDDNSDNDCCSVADVDDPDCVVAVCGDGNFPVITEVEFNQGDERLYINGRARATTGTTITIFNADTGDILKEGIRVREGKWEAEFGGVGSDLQSIIVITSNGCEVYQEIRDDEDHDNREDSEDPPEEATAPTDDDNDKRNKGW